jgi:ABC-type antimicrobial peptide transport system permease subunit
VAQGIVGIFAAVALLLSGIGLYGLLAFLLSQRRREVGIRMALGCQPAGVASLFLRDGLALTGLGLLSGFGLAWLAKPWLESQLYAVSPVEPWVIGAVAATLAMVALLAILLPALRAARIDPTQVLHEQ